MKILICNFYRTIRLSVEQLVKLRASNFGIEDEKIVSTTFIQMFKVKTGRVFCFSR